MRGRLSPVKRAERAQLLAAVRHAEAGVPVARTASRAAVLAAVHDLARPAIAAPTVRQVAEHVGLALGTVTYHLRRLVADGQLTHEGGSGYLPVDGAACPACGCTGTCREVAS